MLIIYHRMAQLTADGFLNFFKYYSAANQNQQDAIGVLFNQLPSDLIDEDTEWIKKYREPYLLPTNPQDNIPPQGIKLCHEFEGCRLEPYLCPAGVPTIGWGNTFYPDGQRVSLSDGSITQQEADEMFIKTATKNFWNVIKDTVPYFSEMNDNQTSALFSFSYNLGAYFYDSSGFATISRVLRERDWNGVPSALLLYVSPGTPYEAGLRRRREAEGQLWTLRPS